MTEFDTHDIIPAGGAQEQVILPWGIALRITMRGLKIRLGRSLITMSGVVLGIAFLMSVLTGEGLRSGLADETRTKTEVTRLLKLVEDEIGTFKDHKLSVLVSGKVTDRHKDRLLRRMAEEADEGSIFVYHTQPDRLEPGDKARRPSLRGPAFTHASDLTEFLKDSHVLLLLHQDLPRIADQALAGYLATMRQPVILDCYHGRYAESDLQQINQKILYTSLTYQMSEEEAAKTARRAAQQKARRIWITIVSILVTLIGISNAMLMSVTERIQQIGTMKCLGALSGFVVKLFLIESFVIGVLGAVVGTILGFVVPFIAYMLSSGVLLLMDSTPFVELVWYGAGSTFAGTVLAIIAAIYPAVVAAKMVPADALRTNV